MSEDSFECDSVKKLKREIDYDRLIAESEPMIEPEDESLNISSNNELDCSDFGIHYRMIRPPNKKMEKA